MRNGAVSGLAAFAAVLFLAGSSVAGTFEVGFSAKAITPIGPSPIGWNFWVNPATGVWSEPFEDQNGNGCYDPGEPFEDDPRNTLIDPMSAGKWDGIWTNAGFSGQCAHGKLDDIWARAVVISNGTTNVALVSLDLVGFFNEEIRSIRKELAAAHPDLPIHALLVSSTHTHQGPDTMGLWGQVGFVIDGKFPLYQKFIRSQVIGAVAEAYARRQPAKVRFAKGTEERGLRDSRPPEVFDTDVWTARFVEADDETKTIGTIVNWSNHPEALGSGNPLISSDFPHGTRERMEEEYGGISIYFSGSVGGLMTPLRVTNIPGFPEDDRSYERTLVLGEIVAESAIEALEEKSGWIAPTDIAVARKEFTVPLENLSLAIINAAGVLDKQPYTAGVPTPVIGEGVLTEMIAVNVGPALFLTVPGELFPEIANGGFGRPDCPEADTGRPYEPVIRDQFDAEYKFILGLGQDELGYIVPGYDFWIWGAPPNSSDDSPVDSVDDRPRAVAPIGLFRATDPCGEDHYEETVSAGSTLAPLVACTAAELAGKDPWNDTENYPACTEENTSAGPLGVKP